MTKERSPELIERIAKVAHEVNLAYCQSIGDNSQPRWENAPQWQKNSAIDGVKFNIDERKHPKESHDNWLKEKTRTGWKYGKVKDEKLKTHPCFMPYEELPSEERSKDYIFKAVIEALDKF